MYIDKFTKIGGAVLKKLLIVCMLLVFLCSCQKSDKIQPDTGQTFRIWQSFVYSHGGEKDTTLRVILCEEQEDLEQTFENIKAFHENINGVSNTLTIKIYENKEEFLNHNCLSEKVYKNH